MIDTRDVLQQFAGAMRDAGISPPESIVGDGTLHRFSISGRPDDDAGWYVLHLDEIPAGAFGNWRTGMKSTWSAQTGSEMSAEDVRQARERQRRAKEAAEAQRKALASEVAKKAQSMWAGAPPAPADHPYLVNKQVKSYGLRSYKESLLVPLSDGGAIISLQIIFPDGRKVFLKDSFSSGGGFILGSIARAETIVIGEGYATLASIHEATGLSCVVAFNAGNLSSVAEKVRDRRPDADIIIAGDDDHKTPGNPGAEKARSVALAIGARLALPRFGEDRDDKDTDFNDLARRSGQLVVADQVISATLPTEPAETTTDSQEGPAETDSDTEDPFTRDIMFDAEAFVESPSHGVGADIIARHYKGMVIYEPFDTQGRGQFHRRKKKRCYYEIVYNIHDQARRILEHYVESYREQAAPTSDKPTELYKKVGSALQKCRTRNFLHGVVQLFAESVTVPGIQWNAIPEVLPTRTDLIDFSGPRPVSRQPKDGEYFRDPLPFDAEDVFKADDTPAFSRFMDEVFPNAETRQTAYHIAALAIANKPRKYFVVLQNAEGNGAKNSFIDILGQVVPNRFAMIAGSAVTTGGDKSERRFAVAEGEGRTAWVFDEISGSFDVPAIKRYTSLSPVRVERKGRDPKEIKPTWLLIAMANDFPSFNPPDDQAFLSRLIVLPFRSVFYSDDDARERYIKMGVEEQRLKPARDKSEILKETHGERPAILARLIAEYILLRDRNNANPAESEECLAAKERYRTANDYIESFFDDSLQRMNGMRISYTRVRELFGEYMGDSRVKMSTRRLIDEITRRYRFIEKRKSNGERVLVNVSEKFDYDKQPGNGEEDPF